MSPYIRGEKKKRVAGSGMRRKQSRDGQICDTDRASEKWLRAEAGMGLKLSGFLLFSLPDVHDQLKKHLIICGLAQWKRMRWPPPYSAEERKESHVGVVYLCHQGVI